MLSLQGAGWLEHSSLGRQESLLKFYQEFVTAPSQPLSDLPSGSAGAGSSHQQVQAAESQCLPEEDELLSVDLLTGCSQLPLMCSAQTDPGRSWDLPTAQQSASGGASGLSGSFNDTQLAISRQLSGTVQAAAATGVTSAETAPGSASSALTVQAAGVRAAVQRSSGPTRSQERPATIQRSAVSAGGSEGASEANSKGSGCLAELQLLAGDIITEGDVEAGGSCGASGRRSLSNIFAGAADGFGAQLLLGDTALQVVASARQSCVPCVCISLLAHGWLLLSYAF